jgi:hypothetical protein
MKHSEFKVSQLKIEIKSQFFVNPPKTIRFPIKGSPFSGEDITGFNRSIVEFSNVSLFQPNSQIYTTGNFNLSIVGMRCIEEVDGVYN